MTEIRIYNPADDDALFAMMREEGDDWEQYYGSQNDKYRRVLSESVTLVAYDGGELCGYVRCRDDGGFGVHVLDLLVRKSKRGRNIGRALLEAVTSYFPGNTVYVHSDVDGYYIKQGYERAGSIFVVEK